jgi:hypothetical protein
MGLPPPERSDFAEHSPFCQVHVCYAREVGCCDPDFKRQESGLEEAQNLPCSSAPASREHSNRVGGEAACDTGWANVNGFSDTCMTPLSTCPSSNSIDADSRGRRLLCVGEGCECDYIGRYVPTCPLPLALGYSNREAQRG